MASGAGIRSAHEHRAGEKLFVDYAGDTIPVYNAATGEVTPAAIFVAVLGASSYTYSEATWTQAGRLDRRHLRTFEFLAACPRSSSPIPESGVTKACRYEPSVNRTYEEMASHCG